MKHSHDENSAHPKGHSNSHPPIDCPMHDRKSGHHHRPFKSVEEYIAHLDREERDQWQKPDAVVSALKLNGTETLADVGAGSGYFSFRFAKALPNGKVVALDIEPEMIAHMNKRAVEEEIENFTAVVSSPDDPKVPSSADWVFICDVLHHVSEPEAWLSRLGGQLRSGAKVAIIEFKQGELPIGPPEWMKISPERFVELMEGTGFAMTSRNDDLLPYQHLFVFTRD
ncbi:MAG: hypothetical protein DHS20C16_16850 [Phycisphaerae bacterium]|nr:MAG: hypothetical protein DHS20C16_16850 [Phycisphaerae bacterium]